VLKEDYMLRTNCLLRDSDEVLPLYFWILIVVVIDLFRCV
jgi:hypothetical protein